jgi:23S rRNA (cytosine1962-C5)-methyltransferase
MATRGASAADVVLVDAGDGRRLERLGDRLIDRPAPPATNPRLAPDAWRRADLRFEAGRGWSGAADPGAPWQVEVAGLRLELRGTSSGGVGLYPEHAENLAWVEARVAELAIEREAASAGAGDPPAVLNLFAHTGLLTLAAARAGAAVAHLDGSRPAVAWARRNAELSGLAELPIRWLVDDAVAFVAREDRRGRRYDGIVLDPPSLGHAGGRRWRLEDDLPGLLGACAAVAAPGAFVLLTAHTTGVDADELAGALRSAFRGARPEILPLELTAESGARLPLGWTARWSP